MRRPREKLHVVEALRTQGAFRKAIFVDDQIEYLHENPYPSVEAYLASWGYLAPDRPGNVAVLTPADFLALLRTDFPTR